MASGSVPQRRLIAGFALALLAVLGLDAATIATSPAAPSDTVSGTAAAPVATPAALRLLRWSGRTWVVYPKDQPGPEPGVQMTDSSRAVYVDAMGRLHLRIIKVKGGWRSVELRALGPVSYGTYRWVVRGDTTKFSRNTVLGMFVYYDTGVPFTGEIDIEDSRFTHFVDPNDAQYVVQPYTKSGHWCTYQSAPGVGVKTQQFTWTPGAVTFTSQRGTNANASPEPLHCQPPGNAHNATATSFTYRGNDVPPAGPPRLYINLWTNKNRPPTDGTHSIVLDSFRIIPPTNAELGVPHR